MTSQLSRPPATRTPAVPGSSRPSPSPRIARLLVLAVAAVLALAAVMVAPASAKPGGGGWKQRGTRVATSTSTTTASSTTSTAPTSTTSTTAATTTTVPPATTTTTATPPPDGGGGAGSSPSGEALPLGDLPGWRQIFADDFTVDVPLGQFPGAVSSRWGAYPDGWRDTMKKGTYSPSKVLSVRGGLLDFSIRTDNGVPLVSAPYPMLPTTKVSQYGQTFTPQLYGRYAVRFRADALDGYKVAWLLWPMSDVWPRDGEIDFPEGDLDQSIDAFMHHQGALLGSDQDAFSSGVGFSQWHTAIIEWVPNRVTFILDGRVLGTTTDRVPNTPMRWVLQTETELTLTMPAPSVAGHVEVDWVAVWAPS